VSFIDAPVCVLLEVWIDMNPCPLSAKLESKTITVALKTKTFGVNTDVARWPVIALCEALLPFAQVALGFMFDRCSGVFDCQLFVARQLYIGKLIVSLRE
jgi:hypothetical protein